MHNIEIDVTLTENAGRNGVSTMLSCFLAHANEERLREIWHGIVAVRNGAHTMALCPQYKTNIFINRMYLVPTFTLGGYWRDDTCANPKAVLKFRQIGDTAHYVFSNKKIAENVCERIRKAVSHINGKG